MNLFKKKKARPTYLIEPTAYPDEYTIRKWNNDYYGYVESIKIESKEHLERVVAFYSQPAVYF